MHDVEHRLIVQANIGLIGKRSSELSAMFYTHLFRINPDLILIFNGGVPMLNRKFNSMLATFKNIRDLEKISSALESMAERHVRYQAEAAHFPQFKDALILALNDFFGKDFTHEIKMAWEKTFDEVALIMTKSLETSSITLSKEKCVANNELHFLDEIGGEETVFDVHQRFYDYIYEDQYIGQFFFHRAKHLVVRKQTDFMVAAFGGPNNYQGEPVAFVHMHMFITEEMSKIRQVYLRRAIQEEGLSEEVCKYWLNVDSSFSAAVEKKSVSDCVMRCWGQQPFTIKKPKNYEEPKA